MGKRYSVNKNASAAKFRSQRSRTKAMNIVGTMRGGWRL